VSHQKQENGADVNTDDTVSRMVEKIEAGDKRAEDQFYRHFRPLVQIVLRQMTQDASLVEDMTQDTLLTVLLRVRGHGLKQPEKINSYVAQTARFSLRGWFRRKGNHRDSLTQLTELEAPGCDIEDALLTVERQELVKNIIGLMSVPRDKEMLERSYIHDQDKVCLCQQFDLPGVHFDRVMSRARLRFKRVVQTQSDETQRALLAF
jgi:RNA polymerase sigma factor (sigma-70 family)